MAIATEKIEYHLRERLGALRASYEQALIAPRSVRQDTAEALFAFEVGTAALAVPTSHLVAVIRADGMVAVPCSPPHIAGALAHGQEVLSVLSLSTLLKVADHGDAKDKWVLVLRPRSRQWALSVDSVIGVRKLDPGSLGAASERDGGTSFLMGNMVIDDRSVAILDIEALSLAVACVPPV